MLRARLLPLPLALVAALIALAGPRRAHALEVWLASTEGCAVCDLWRRAAQARGYRRALVYPDGPGLTIPILSIDKKLLAPDVVSQLPADDGPADPRWDVTLTVLVMDAGRVLFAGDIAESADPDALRHPLEVMFPPPDPADDHPALRGDDIHAPFAVREWNLEYFVDVALGKRPRRAASRPVDLASPAPAALGARNVILWGSADTPLANAAFIPARIAEIRAALDGLGLRSIRYLTLHGHGPGVEGNDASHVEDGHIRFMRAEPPADYAADAEGVNAVLTGVLEQPAARTLLVQVGRSGPNGAPLWGRGTTLQPGDLEPIARAGRELVMVSGACHGGRFAKAAQCGFFADHPDAPASACELPAAAGEAADDYLQHFFAAAAGAGTPAKRRGREPVTLYDAHWQASMRLEGHRLTYTTTDALIDDHFAAHPEDLPDSLSVAELRAAAPTLAPAEADAVAALTAGLAPDLRIPLTGHVEASRRLAAAGEASTAEGDAGAPPYKLVLTLLARRVAYAALEVPSAEYAAAAACERRPLTRLLGAGR